MNLIKCPLEVINHPNRICHPLSKVNPSSLEADLPYSGQTANFESPKDDDASQRGGDDEHLEEVIPDCGLHATLYWMKLLFGFVKVEL